MLKTEIFIHDEFDPEANAMLQALYSRSAQSVAEHIEKVHESGSKKFMQSYYVNYGHASIGDCGTTTMFFEGVSILFTKALQDHPLYSGQECSTRYLDFSTRPLYDPINNDMSKKIYQNWIEFYTESGPIVREYLAKLYPRKEDEKETIWKKAIKARSFDIMRSFLPAGVTTQLSWSSNLRQAHEKLTLLRHHPLKEVSDLATNTLVKLKEKYPSSFSHKTYETQENYFAKHGATINYSELDIDPDFSYESEIDNALLEKNHLDLISERPQKTNLPRVLKQYGNYRCRFLLDYGSFRDLQRHRNGLCQIPLLRAKYGFNEWYLEQLPEELQEKARTLIDEQLKLIDEFQEKHQVDKYTLQYFLPLGMKVACELVYDLPEMVYVTELRSSNTVHPTLRKITREMHAALVKEHPKLALYSDLSDDKWTIKRGEQDIVRKDN